MAVASDRWERLAARHEEALAALTPFFRAAPTAAPEQEDSQ
jgi:hypothetical protein